MPQFQEPGLYILLSLQPLLWGQNQTGEIEDRLIQSNMTSGLSAVLSDHWIVSFHHEAVMINDVTSKNSQGN